MEWINIKEAKTEDKNSHVQAHWDSELCECSHWDWTREIKEKQSRMWQLWITVFLWYFCMVQWLSFFLLRLSLCRFLCHFRRNRTRACASNSINFVIKWLDLFLGLYSGYKANVLAGRIQLYCHKNKSFAWLRDFSILLLENTFEIEISSEIGQYFYHFPIVLSFILYQTHFHAGCRGYLENCSTETCVY